MKTGRKTPEPPEKVTAAQLGSFLEIPPDHGQYSALGAVFNKSRQTVHNWISRGRVPKEVLTQLADDYGISVKELTAWITRKVVPPSRSTKSSAQVIPLWRHRLLPPDLQTRIDRLNEFQLGRVQQAIRVTLAQIETEENDASTGEKPPR